MDRESELKVRGLQQGRRKTELLADIRLSNEEIVEDAGLDEPEPEEVRPAPKRKRTREVA
jgi:hypothetical protein